MKKKRILMVSEASYTLSGYGTYTKEVLSRLHKTGKYEIAEFASYAHVNDPRDKAPWRIYPNGILPNDPRNAELNSKPFNQFGMWRFERVLLDFKPDIVFDIRDPWMFMYQNNSPLRKYFHWCFTGDTPVLTCGGGCKNIEKLEIGDSIFDGNGDKTTVKNISSRIANSTIAIRCAGWTIPFECTPEHRWFVIPYRGRTHDSVKKRYKNNIDSYDSSQAVEIEASLIKKGDMVIAPILSIGNEQPPLPWSKELATLVGYYLAEGTCDKYGHIRWAFNINENEYCEEVRSAINTLWPHLKIEDRSIEENNVRIIGINSVELYRSIWSHFKTSQDKLIPEWVLSANTHNLKEIVRCYVLGDGCNVVNANGYNGIETFTCSKHIAMSMWQILLRLGICANVYERNHHGHIGYRFTIYGQHFDKLSSFVNKNRVIPHHSNIKKDRIWIDKHNMVVAKVTDVKQYQKTVKVYDIEVNSDAHTFCIPYRVHNCIMPTVDSAPQQEEWIQNFIEADGVFTYSDFGYDTLKKEGGGLIKLISPAPPGANLVDFKPILNKTEHRRKWGFPEDVRIIGTVMRNQRRKLFPDLMVAFNLYLDKCRAEGRDDLARKSFLYFHTSYPDVVGCWNIPRLIKEKGLGSKILFTYMCKDCGNIFAGLFQDARTVCPRCHKASALLPSVGAGLSTAQLGEVMNLFDVYVQYATCEGFGMPQVEAASCGVPVMATDYSAMSDVSRKLKGWPIKVARMTRSVEEDADKALPDNHDFADKAFKFLSQTQSERQERGLQARAAVEKHYTWDRTAKIWEDYFDSVELVGLQGKWDAPPQFLNPIATPEQCPQNLTNQEFIEWMIIYVLGDESKLNSMLSMDMNRALNYELSVLTSHHPTPFTRKHVVDKFMSMVAENNHLESLRCGFIPLSQEDYIEYANRRAV